MIKNIVFDLGNVLLDFDPERYLSALNYKDELKEKLIENIFKTEQWLLLDRGVITEEEAVEIWKKDNPVIAAEIEEIMKDWAEILTLKKESINILEKLAEKNYNLYVLSNFHKKAYNYVSNKYNFFNLFDDQLISAKIGMIKPEPEIFELLLEKFNLKAEATLFIDDSKENIEAALEQGIRVIHFKNAEALKEELKLYLK